MTTPIFQANHLVDYLAGANDFFNLMSITVPDMKLRGKSAEWVLTFYQSRRSVARGSHTISSPYFRPRRPLQVVPQTFKPTHELAIFKHSLEHMQKLHILLFEVAGIPSTQTGRIARVLMRHPVITVAQMSEGALVSEATAKRWLKALCKSSIRLREVAARGLNVYVNDELCALINTYG